MSNREKEIHEFQRSSPSSFSRMGFIKERKRQDKSIIRVLKEIANQKEARFYEPPALRKERPDIENTNFQGLAEWERKGKPKIVSYDYPDDILEWIHRDKNKISPVFDYDEWLKKSREIQDS